MREFVAHSDFEMGSLDQSFCCSESPGLIPMEMKQWSLETTAPSDLTHPRAGPWALRSGFLPAFQLDCCWTGHGGFQKDIQTSEVLEYPLNAVGLRNKLHLWAFKQGAAGKEQALRRYWLSGEGQQRTPSSLFPHLQPYRKAPTSSALIILKATCVHGPGPKEWSDLSIPKEKIWGMSVSQWLYETSSKWLLENENYCLFLFLFKCTYEWRQWMQLHMHAYIIEKN